MSIASLILLIATVSFASLASILVVDNFAATAVDDDKGNGNNNNNTISNGEQEWCYGDRYKENMSQIIIQGELGTNNNNNNNSTDNFDIAIKNGQVCVYMNDYVDEGKSNISQLARMRNSSSNNNNCDQSTCIQLHQGEGDNEIGGISITGS